MPARLSDRRPGSSASLRRDTGTHERFLHPEQSPAHLLHLTQTLIGLSLGSIGSE